MSERVPLDAPLERGHKHQPLVVEKEGVTFEVDVTPASPGPDWEWPPEAPSQPHEGRREHPEIPRFGAEELDP